MSGRIVLGGIFVVSACILLSNFAIARTTSVKGSSELNLIENACPQPERRDCKTGTVCHMSIRLKGQPAVQLLHALKQKVQKEDTFKQWGLTIYISKDGLLSCNETEKVAPFCDIWFSPIQAKIEPGA